jgi:hypothetical protein
MPEAHDTRLPRPLDGDEVEIRWMTYGEISQARGISLASARGLVYRRKWRRQPGNDGTTRVAVPLHETSLRTGHDATIADNVSRLASGLEAALLTLQAQLDRERGRADEAVAQLSILEAQITRLQATTELATLAKQSLERALTAAESNIGQAESELALLRTAFRSAEAEIAILREAEQVRRERTRLVRLKAAWRGQC